MKIIQKTAVKLLAAVVFLCLIPAMAVNAAPKTVKVGYFQFSGYQEVTEEGSRWGYGYDYLQEISKFADIKYEYVDATYSECLEMLRKGEVDMVTCARYTPERAEFFDFSQYRMGILYSMLTVRLQEDRYSYNDYKSFGGMKVGYLRGNSSAGELQQIAAENEVIMELQPFETEKQLREALEEKSIDAIVSSNQRILEEEKIIAKFYPTPFYILVMKGDQELLDVVNSAMEEIIYTEPYFEGKLYEKYFSNTGGYELELSAEERAYIQTNPLMRVVTTPNTEPDSYYQDGQYTGIVMDMLQTIAGGMGMQVEYIPTESYQQALAYVREGKADVVGDFYFDYSWADRNQFSISLPYMETRYVSITKKNATIDRDKARVATCKDFFFNTIYVYKQHESDRVFFYKTEEESMKAVRDGKADIAYVSQNVASVLLKKDLFLGLEGNTVYGSEFEIATATSRNNRMLSRILDKGICNLSQKKMTQIIEKYTEAGEDQVSLTSYIYYNLAQFLIIFILIALLIIGALTYILLQRRKYHKHIFKLAYYDELTGLNNIHYFEEIAEKKQEQKGKHYCIISLDISRFAVINETYGRPVGDTVIRYVAQHLREMVEEKDILVRNKSDHFLIMMHDGGRAETEAFIAGIREKIGCMQHGSNEIRLNYNCGVAEINGDNTMSLKKSLDRAELARKMAKSERFHTKFYHKDMEELLLEEKEIEDSMRRALTDGDFVVYYQPKFDMLNGRVMGAEALVRWKHKKRGFMSPISFIPILERNGFIVEVDFYVLEQVCKMQKKLLDAGKKVVPVSVNQSRLHFLNPDYTHRLNAMLKRYQIPQKLLELELTESIFANMKEISKVVMKLKENGYFLSVDDFGAGYSSLNMLKEMPLDTLKIDKDFLINEAGNNRYRKVVQKVVELAKDLDMNVICEGVEYEEQAEFLKSVGCNYAQGFLYAKPMPEEEFIVLLQKDKEL